MFQAILLSLLLMLILHDTAYAAKTQDVYFDSESTSSHGNGSMTNPYKDLISLLEVMRKITVATELNVYLKPRSQPYTLKTDPSTTFKNRFFANFTITSWTTQDEPEESLPIINGTGIYLALDSIPFVNFTRVKFIEMNGTIQINMAQVVIMTDLCLDDETSKSNQFFSIKDADNFIVQRVNLSIGNAKEIISYSNSKSTESIVSIDDMTISFSQDSTRESTNQEVPLRFTSSFGESTSLSINKIQLKNSTKMKTQMFSQLFEITKFSTVEFKEFKISDQEMQISGKKYGVFRLREITTLTIQKAEISKNIIDSPDKMSLFFLKNVTNINLLDANISENSISGGSSSSNKTNSLKIFQIEEGGASSITMKNASVFKNKYSISTYIIHIQTEALATTSLKFTDIIIDSNLARNNNNLNLLMFDGTVIKDFQAENITISNNNFSGKIFDIAAIGDVTLTSQNLEEITIQHNLLKFTDISVINNENLVNFGLLTLSVENPSILPLDYVPDYEFYAVVMQNLIIENSAFLKGQQNSDLAEKMSVIQIAGAQISIEDSTLADNNFTSFSFASIYRELSSIFFINSSVDNTNFTEAHFLITKYESLMVNQGPFFGASIAKKKEVEAIYRYAFVLNSNFTNMQIQEGSLFTFHNAFLLMENNTFDFITFTKSSLLKAGRFHAPGSDISGVKFIRNEKVEEDSLRLNPTLFYAYQRMIAEFSGFGFGETIIYLYAVNLNNLNNFKVYSKSLINFEDYQSPQSAIYLKGNDFMGFEFPDVVTDIIKLSGSLKAFYFYMNFLDDLNGPGSMLRLSSLEENEFIDFSNNTITNNEGPSIITASGTELNDITIAYNEVVNNTFSNTVFTINILLLKDDIMFLSNSFQNNILDVNDQDLNTINSFIKLSSDTATEDTSFIFQYCVFVNNTYRNTRLFNQYGHLNAMITLLIANSDIVIQDNIFQDFKMLNQGRDLFYIAAQMVYIKNCTFQNANLTDGQSIFNFLSRQVYLFENKFTGNSLPIGKGLIYISPHPFLKGKIDLGISSNIFQNQDDSGNLLQIENCEIDFKAIGNYFYNTLSSKSVFHFSNITFLDSQISNSRLFITKYNEVESFFYQIDSSSGDLAISQTIIDYAKNYTTIDTLLKCQMSPKLNVVISNLTWSSHSTKNPVRLADIDSGNVFILDIIIHDFIYPLMKKTDYFEQRGLLINVRKSTSELNLLLRNVSCKNLQISQEDLGEISLIGIFSPSFESSGINPASKPWRFGMENCSFISIKDIAVVSIDMTQNFNIKIDKTIFESISSYFGPAFGFYTQADTGSNILITQSTFVSCSARQAGGAVYIANAKYDFQGNFFRKNTATDLGGAIIIEDKLQNMISIFDQNAFVLNHALVGQSIGSLPTHFNATLIFPNGTSIKDGAPITIRDLSKVALNIMLVDSDNEISLDTFATGQQMAIISFADQPSITTFNCTKRGCFINSLNVTLTGNPNQIKTIEIQYSSEGSENKFQKKLNITVSPCIEGEHFNPKSKTCDSCGFGTYSFTPDDICQKCPKNAYCPGGSMIIPDPGYWRSVATGKTSSEILQCRKDGIARCAASYEHDIFSQCSKGYEGVKCEACAIGEGYVEAGLLQCKKCKDVALSFVITILSVVGFTLLKLYSINRLYKANQSLCSTTDSKQTQKENLESTYYVRLLLRFTQILSMIYLFHNEIREFVGSYIQIGNPSEFTSYKLECSMEFLGVPSHHYIFGSFIFLFLSPLIQFLLTIIIARLFIKKLFEPATRYFLRLCTIYIILSEQPSIVGFMTGFLSCSQDDPDSPPYVGLHPSTKCNTYEYFIIRYFIVIPCLVLWGVLIPLYMFSSVYLKRERLNQLVVRLPWGVLYNIYKPEYYWWGTVSTVLGITLGFTTYFFQGDFKTCLVLAFILLWIYQIAVRKAKPYVYESWNQMEATTMGLLVLNLMLGFFTMNTPVKELKMMAYVALAVINGAMLSFIIYKIVRPKVVTFVDKISRKMTKRNSQRIPLLDDSFVKNEEERYHSVDGDDSNIIQKDISSSTHPAQDTSLQNKDSSSSTIKDGDNSKIQEAPASHLIL